MGMREDLKIPLTMLSISFLNKLPYLGSYKGLRFKFENSVDESNNKKLKVYVWKDLFCFEKTPINQMTIKEFAYNSDGINEGIDFVENEVDKL